MTPSDSIHIRGARVHNLRDLSVDIPIGQLTVITGVSGSGKSSLAHDTLFAEGQRRYLESLSVYSRRLLQSVARPDVDEVSGLPPTVSVDQRAAFAPARSTLAVTTEIHDFLRLLYARAGIVHCTGCHRVVSQQTIDEIVTRILGFPDGSRFILLAPLVRNRKGSHRDVLERITRNGLVRARIDGELCDIASADTPAPTKPHSIDAVVDRLILKPGVESRIRESVALAVRESGDACIAALQQDGTWEDHYFNTRHSCSQCGISFPDLDPGLFSFNNARGACTACEGMGIHGVADDSDDITVFRRERCQTCQGSRLQPLPSMVTFGGLTLAEFTALSVDASSETVARWLKDGVPVESESPAAAHILPDVHRRLESLQQVGLGYLTLSRPTRTLSGGEYQRARLASCLGNRIHGACYVLDEPTNGLHPRDTQRLLLVLRELRNSGATVVLVEHDPDVIEAADFLIEIGPGAGADGGELLYAGTPADSATVDATTKPAFMAAERPDANAIRSAEQFHQIVIRGASLNNLKGIDVAIPLNRFVCVTGVSGSGKSSLIMNTLLPVLETACRDGAHDALIAAACADARCVAVEGLKHLDRAVAVDSRPVGRNRRSCIATLSGVWNDIRSLLTKTREARAKGMKSGVFSFNSGSGRCSACRGTGVQELRMSMLPDAEIPCPACGGNRFGSEVLGIRFAGRNAHAILKLRVDEALVAFAEMDVIRRQLQPFHDVGLGYMTLGQPASTYSGGEAQRVHLAMEVGHADDRTTLYVFDEPTRGLHTRDIDRLLILLGGLINRGDSVLVIEHSVQVMKSSDWIIDIGPDAADDGGYVVAEGTLSAIAESADSLTGAFLK